MLRSLFIAILTTPFFALTKPIPVEDLFRNAEFAGFQISPDGTYLAAIGEWEDRYNLFVFNLETGQPQRLTAMKRNNVTGLAWASDTRLLYFMDLDGNESLGVFAIDRDGGNPETLVEPLATKPGVYQFRYTLPLDLLDNEDDYILAVNNDNQSDYPDVYRMNIQRGGKKIEVSNPGNVISWITDQSGVVRIGMTSDKAAKKNGIIYRENADSEWRSIATFSKDSPSWAPIAFDHDGKTLYVSSNLDADTRGIYKYDLESMEMGDLIYRNDTFDAAGLLYSDYRKDPIGVRYAREKAHQIWFDEEKEMIQGIIDNTFPDTTNVVTTMSDDESKMVVASYSDKQAAFYTLFSIEGGSLKRTPLGFSREWLKPEDMAEVQPITYETRDGLTIHGYLTLPKDYDGETPIGLIVHPHGGPWARDNWGFNPTLQFFASRGFGVLQMDFRSSTGYGRKHEKAGNKKWGEEMQLDVIDALDWTIENYNIDESRVGIYGASYGGYTVMAQLTQFPERYHFGINNVGPVDLFELIEHRRELKQLEVVDYYNRTIGHIKDERELLEKHSPINYIENIDDPIFIIHGVKDPRVPISQARMLRTAMKKHKKPFEWLVKTDEGHGFRKEENRIEQYEKIEQFIKPWTKL